MMEKSNTVDISTVETAVDCAVKYLKSWTRTELLNLVQQNINNNQTPLIIKMGSRGYLIGYYFLEPIEKRWWRLSCSISGDQKHIFSSKIAAVCYAMCSQRGYFNKADRILKDDDAVGRLTMKTEHFYRRYRQAIKKKNSQKTDLFLVRYQESSLRLADSRNLLEKTLTSAKYIKF